MSCSIITIGDVARNHAEQLLHVAALLDRQPCERLIEHQQLRILR